jgi:hypothetical protein
MDNVFRKQLAFSNTPVVAVETSKQDATTSRLIVCILAQHVVPMDLNPCLMCCSAQVWVF